MEQTFLKSDTIFSNGKQRLFMYTEHFMLEPDDTPLSEVAKVVCTIYPVIDYTIKENTLYVLTEEAYFDIELFDLKSAYTHCINAYNKSQPYFETDITHENVIVKENTFKILPSSSCVFSQRKRTLQEFRDNTIQELHNLTQQKDEEMFDKLLKKLYNAS